jgi:tetratricopeptide (TPR) repeat protein
MSRSDLQPWGLGLVLAVGVAALYAPAVGFGFLLTDDTMYVAANPWVKSGLTWAGVEWAFTTFEASNWHPTTWLSLMLDAELFGPEPAGFHRTNVALHALAVVLAFAALRAATGRTGLAAFVAGVFAVHPAHVETVAWIPERKHLLAGACGLAALLAYVRYAQRGGALRYAAVFGLTAVGMLAKPVLVTWPCVLLLLDVWPLARWCPGGLDGRAGVAPEVQRARAASPGRLLLEKAPLLALSLGVSLATLAAQGPAMGVAAGVSLGARLENAVVSVARYLARYVWPRELGFLDPLPALRGESWGISLWLGSLALLAAIALFAALRLRRAPFVAVGAAWFLGVLVPVLGLLQVGTQATADRYTYLPYLGVSLALAWSVDAAVRTSAPAVRAATIAAAVVFLAGLGVRTSLQLPVWRSSEALFEHALRMAPDEPEALVALANSYLVRGRAADATPLVRRALERDPRNGPALETLAILLASEGNLARAVQAQRDALAVSPSRPRPWLQLGKLLQASGRAQEAIDAYEASLRLQPEQTETLRLLAGLLAADGRDAEAQARFDQAARGLEARLAAGIGRLEAERGLGWIAIERGAAGEALPHFERVLAEAARDRSALRGRAHAMLEAGHAARALVLAREAITLGGEDPQTRAIEVRALEALGELEQAAAALRAMLERDPGHALAPWARKRLARIEGQRAP